jgi:peptide/nickel transport system permease protein
MLRYLAARALGAMVSIVGVTAIVFVVLRVSGDPAALLIDPTATPQQFAELRHSLGLDASIPEQYVRFIGGVLRGDFGTSFRYHQPAMPTVLARVPATMTLALATLVFTLVLAIPLGIIAAVRRDTLLDRAVSLITLIGQGTPSFWLGIVLILLVAVDLRLLPTSGNSAAANLVLPMLTLSAAPISKYTRLTRAEMLEVLASDYIRTARAKGLSEFVVRFRHALKNASIALVTLIGLDVGFLLGGSIIVETVFAWPGVGRLMIDAVSQQDFPVVQADVFLLACVVVVANFVVDAVYPLLDPRISLAR